MRRAAALSFNEAEAASLGRPAPATSTRLRRRGFNEAEAASLGRPKAEREAGVDPASLQ